MSTKEIGDIGEHVASEYLRKRGFIIVEHNYRKKWGEIDIIARKSGITHFVEVKAVTKPLCKKEKGSWHRPEDNVHPEKLKRLHRAIETYILERNITSAWVLDVVTVYLNMDMRRARCIYMPNII